MTEETREITLIPIDRLRTDEDYQPRVRGLDHRHVRLVAEQLQSDGMIPALLVAPDPERPGSYIVLDGAHRLEALHRIGHQGEVPCQVVSEPDYERAVQANLDHGLPLSIEDRKAYACWLAEQEPGLSLREIARRARLSHNTVKRALEEGGQNDQRDTARLTPERAAAQLLRGFARLWDARSLLSRLSEDRAVRELAHALARAAEADPAARHLLDRMARVLAVATAQRKGDEPR